MVFVWVFSYFFFFVFYLEKNCVKLFFFEYVVILKLMFCKKIMEGREKERDYELFLLKKNDINNINRVIVMLFKCYVL